jgi:hypothetical protein
MLFKITKEARYLAAARLANQFVRRTIPIGQHIEIDGGVRGSYPVTGDYGRYQFLNWAAKFMVDSNSLELELLQADHNGPDQSSDSGPRSTAPRVQRS